MIVDGHLVLNPYSEWWNLPAAAAFFFCLIYIVRLWVYSGNHWYTKAWKTAVCYTVCMLIFSFFFLCAKEWWRGAFEFHMDVHSDNMAAACVSWMGDSFAGTLPPPSIYNWQVTRWDERFLYTLEAFYCCIRAHAIILLPFGIWGLIERIKRKRAV